MKFEIPPIMQHLHLDKRGYPIPFFVPIDANGEPNFNYQDDKRRHLCVDKKLCSICGKKLIKGVYWFVSGPMGLANKIGSDPPMHYECALAAMRICPHLLYKKHPRIDKTVFSDPHVIREKPDKLYLVMADHFSMSVVLGRKYIKFRPRRTIEFAYIDNKLTQI